MRISPILKRKLGFSTHDSQDQVSSDTNAVEKSEESINQSDESKDLESDISIRRNSSDITIISNPSQSSIAIIPEPEMNLHAIIERDSQSSLSPPVSQDSVYYKAYDPRESKEISESNEPEAQSMTLESSHIETNHDDFTEGVSFEGANYKESNKNTSNESEDYISNSDLHVEGKDLDLDQVSQMFNILGEKRTITYDMFSEIDHRLKLHLEINVFGSDEELEACLQTSIVPLLTGDEFTGLFAISSKKIYLIKFLPLYSLKLKESKPIEKEIQVLHSHPLSKIKQVKVILGNQGLSIVCGSQVFTLVIRDADVCNSFSSLLSDTIANHQEDVKTEFLSSADETLQLINDSLFSTVLTSSETPEVLLHLFGFWWNSQTGEKDSSTPVCVILTADDIFISKILYKKQDSSSDLRNLNVYHYFLVDHQKMSDLISLTLKKDYRSVELSFGNESSPQQNGETIFWTIKMETKSALFSLICGLRDPWEKVFGVPIFMNLEQ